MINFNDQGGIQREREIDREREREREREGETEKERERNIYNFSLFQLHSNVFYNLQPGGIILFSRSL